MQQVTQAFGTYNELCANQLINQIENVVKPPYKKWKIGVAGSKGLDTERYINVALFSVHNEEAIIAAYNYFKEQGMIAKPVLDSDARYLYLYKIGGTKMPANIF